MRTIAPAEFIRRVRLRAAELPLDHLDPLIVLLAKAKTIPPTLEARAIAHSMVGIMTGQAIEEQDVFALEATTLGWISEFAERWSQGMYGEDELPEVVRLLSPCR